MITLNLDVVPNIAAIKRVSNPGEETDRVVSETAEEVTARARAIKDKVGFSHFEVSIFNRDKIDSWLRYPFEFACFDDAFEWCKNHSDWRRFNLYPVFGFKQNVVYTVKMSCNKSDMLHNLGRILGVILALIGET